MANLEFGDNRAAQIFSLLCTAHSMETSALAARFAVSDRTIRNDIKQLNAQLGDCAAIEGEQGSCRLHVYDGERFREVRARILESDSSFNSPRNLAMEATYINHNFSQQGLRMVSPQERVAPAC